MALRDGLAACQNNSGHGQLVFLTGGGIGARDWT